MGVFRSDGSNGSRLRAYGSWATAEWTGTPAGWESYWWKIQHFDGCVRGRVSKVDKKMNLGMVQNCVASKLDGEQWASTRNAG